MEAAEGKRPVDYFSVIRLPEDEFEALLQLVDRAVGARAATLVSTGDQAWRVLEVFDPRRAGITEEEWARWDDIVFWMDYVMVLAFEDAPENVVRRWAERHDPSLVDQALARVRSMPDLAPNLRRLWTAKTDRLHPSLNEPEYALIRTTEDEEMVSALVEWSASRIEFPGQVDKTSTVRFVTKLHPNDIVLLQTQLGGLLEAVEAERERGQDQ